MTDILPLPRSKAKFVVDDAKRHFLHEGDFIVLGDLNADCSYFDEKDMKIPLWSSDFQWLITNGFDTNVAGSG